MAFNHLNGGRDIPERRLAATETYTVAQTGQLGAKLDTLTAQIGS